MCPGSLTCQAGGAPAGGGDDAAVAGGGPALTARLLDPGWRVSAVMRERPVVSGAASYEILEIRAPRKPWWIMCSFQMKKVPVCRGCGARGTGGCPVCGDFFPAADTPCPCRPVQGGLPSHMFTVPGAITPGTADISPGLRAGNRHSGG